MMTTAKAPLQTESFQVERFGLIMRPQQGDPYEAWGVLNPGGARGRDGAYYLFPRLVAQGNYSRIGRARVIFTQDGAPLGVERLGVALEPSEPYEMTRLGGGIEDARVTYVPTLDRYVMAYTAYVPGHPRIALAVSEDLRSWTRLGPLQYASGPGEIDLNACGNKDGVVFPDVVRDPQGRLALAIAHRPTYAIEYHCDGCDVIMPPCGIETLEHIWISYAPLERVRADLSQLTHVSNHRRLMAPQADWEQLKIGAGAPPVRLAEGWLFTYHAVSPVARAGAQQSIRYCMGVALFDLEDPRKTLYRSPQPVLEPELAYEVDGAVANVVFPTAVDLRGSSVVDLYYGAADSVIGAARLCLKGR